MSGPPPGAGAGASRPTPEQMAMFKEAGVRKLFVANLGDSIGPYIMGYVFNLIMLGILFAQIWHWAEWTKKERPLIKVIVWWVLFFSVASSSFAMVWFYNLFCTSKYGKFSQFVDNTWFSWLPIMDQCAIAACQIFNLDRAYRLNGNNKWLLVAVLPFMLGASGVIIARKAVVGGSDFNAAVIIRPYMYTYFFTTVLIDGLLTGAIAYGLWKSKTGWKHTDALIKRIIIYTVETQLLPTIAAIIMSIQYAINNDTFMAFLYMQVQTSFDREKTRLISSICQAKIPAVMLMAVLNYRLSLRKDPKIPRHMSTEALVRVKGQGSSKGDAASETNSYPMGAFNASSSDWQLPDGAVNSQPMKA